MNKLIVVSISKLILLSIMLSYFITLKIINFMFSLFKNGWVFSNLQLKNDYSNLMCKH